MEKIMEKKIYLDNAATTKTRPEVVEAMLPYFTELYGNPSSIYEFASQNKKAVNQARGIISKVLNADEKDIYFTGGGTESDNWAIKETAEAYKEKGNHIITSAIEHHAVLHTCEWLEKQGFEVTYIRVDENGVLKLDELKAAIRPTTILISVMFANNEVGTIQPVKEIGEIAKANNILFHTDAVQAFGQVPIDVEELNIDMLSASAHKVNGPKGIGLLYIRKGLKLRSFIHGGAQERHRRAGTENVPGIIGFGKAIEIAAETMEERTEREIKLRDLLIERILAEIPYTRLNGHRMKRLPNNANFSFQFIEGESLLIMLDMENICGSSGSACTSGSLDPSHVLLGIGLPHEIAHGSLRLTLSHETTEEEIKYTIEKIREIVDKLRRGIIMYSEKVMDHFSNPRNVGEIENASGVGTVGNAKCGDIMRIYLDIDQDGVIKDCKFKTFGCGAAVATSSMATELVMGMHINEALKVTNKAVMDALDGLPPVKVHCSLLAEEAIHAALWDYAQKHNIIIEGLEQPKTDIGEEEVEEEY
ncbi:cysteine desulfurylase family member [Holotrichia oblita]|nr:cysteine desulfurylase family member [Holotrichia oblita]